MVAHVEFSSTNDNHGDICITMDERLSQVLNPMILSRYFQNKLLSACLKTWIIFLKIQRESHYVEAPKVLPAFPTFNNAKSFKNHKCHIFIKIIFAKYQCKKFF